MDKEAFIARLRYCMQHKLHNNKPLTAYRLDKLGIVKQSSMENYLNGVNSPDVETLSRIADYFCVSIDWLVSGEKFDERIFFNEESHNMIALFNRQEQLIKSQIEKLENIENSIKSKSQKSKVAPSEPRA